MEPKTQTEVSPVTQTIETMSFPEAIAEATIGRRIQRLEWHDSEYGYFKENFLMIHRDGEEGLKDYVWLVSHGDATSEDWVTL